MAAQTYRPLQAFVVDDGSTDRTRAIVADWLRQLPVGEGLTGELLEQAHKGGGAARNLGIAACRGEWIQFLDADDLLGPGKIAAQVARFRGIHRASPTADGGSGSTSEPPSRCWNSSKGARFPKGATSFVCTWRVGIAHAIAICGPANLVSRLGGFDASLGADQDGDFMLRALAAGALLRHVPGVEVQYRAHGSGQVSGALSRTKFRYRVRVARKIAAILEGEGRIEPYRRSLAIRLDELRRMCCVTYPALAEICRRSSEAYWPGHEPAIRGGLAYRLARRLLGLEASEWLSLQKRKVLRRGDD